VEVTLVPGMTLVEDATETTDKLLMSSIVALQVEASGHETSLAGNAFVGSTGETSRPFIPPCRSNSVKMAFKWRSNGVKTALKWR
jgi:hypothetical protein